MSKVRCLLAAALLLTLLWGCSKDCPVCPVDEDQPETPAYKGWLYFTEGSMLHNFVYKLDTETDSIVDSVCNEASDFSPKGVGVSRDGLYLAVGYNNLEATVHVTRIYDAQTLDFVTEISDQFLPLFDDQSHLLIRASNGAITIYDIPSFAPVLEDEVPGFWGEAIDESNKLIYGIDDDLHLLAYDYGNRLIADSIHIVPWPGDTCVVFQFCLNDDRTRIYYRAASHRDTHLGCYDIDSRQVLYTYPTPSEFGAIAVSPDDREVYFTDWGPRDWIGYTGTIYILDATTGNYLQGISLYGYSEHPMVAPLAHTICFTPQGDKAYVACGLVAKYGYPAVGAVVSVDTRERKITRLIPPELDRFPIFMAIGPKR